MGDINFNLAATLCDNDTCILVSTSKLNVYGLHELITEPTRLNVFSYGLRLTHCSSHVGSLHVRMCFFGCISLARVFILRVSEFSLSRYRSSMSFFAVDFIILRESFSINFSLFSFAARPSTASGFPDKSEKEHLLLSTVNCLAWYCLEF